MRCAHFTCHSCPDTQYVSPIKGAVRVIVAEQFDGGTCLTVDCSNGYDDFKSLPQAVTFNGKVFGKTGWNSDRGVAYYRDDEMVALPR